MIPPWKDFDVCLCMNILFLLKSLDIGGIEVVTSVLANKFVAEGHHVALWVFYEGKTSLADRLDRRIKVVCGNGFNAARKNVRMLRDVLVKENIQVAVNQWGLPYVPLLALKRASRGLDVKVISAYHNDPFYNGRIKEAEIALENGGSLINRIWCGIKLYVAKKATSYSMRYVYRRSDKYLLLSKSFLDRFKKFTGIRHPDKLLAQTNPITIDMDGYQPDLSGKRKDVIYVGRLDNQQKRVRRVIETWALLESRHPDWTLRIVGDGEERENLEDMCRNLNLRHVCFEGFRQPMEYYKRASILMLVSEYEGFGLVIVEGMMCGVVPVVLGSYAAVFDILNPGRDGFIIPYDAKKGFHPEVMAERIAWLMENDDSRKRMALNAIRKSHDFSLDTIYDQWIRILRQMLKE